MKDSTPNESCGHLETCEIGEGVEVEEKIEEKVEEDMLRLVILKIILVSRTILKL